MSPFRKEYHRVYTAVSFDQVPSPVRLSLLTCRQQASWGDHEGEHTLCGKSLAQCLEHGDQSGADLTPEFLLLHDWRLSPELYSARQGSELHPCL